ncbi:mediator of RNA polymerase II transcription subunit 7-like [Limulus polyphemus]|uniref:Mediator of RNA polymerase II transcription subunit 7 n=1 Tax=Limulus polyphemus TaxID=6850 RepID=A0ABM1BW20_LIMPO|nr:mediator of RNA polymerase II transcription subunit 7-like [Limulus polyphemus]XP_022257758.1 mediator of RNA polymerase II transcription subunit 7-like [Limulus polyphemus]
MSEPAQVSSFPLPPLQFVNWYTDENIERGRAPSPPKPVLDSYTMFGVHLQTDDVIIRPLESQGIRRLYPQNYDNKRELKKLNHSILVNFLDLLDILIRCPDTSKREEKQDDIKLLFIHMHHLINEYRPYQARDTLRVMLEVQKRQRLETAERFQKHLDKVRELLHNTLSSLPETADLDSNLIVPEENMDTTEAHKAECQDCYRLDKLMCNIIDAI